MAELGVKSLGLVDDDGERARVARTHARWDRLDRSGVVLWFLSLGDDDPELLSILKARLDEHPHHPFLLRTEQDIAKDDAREVVCARHRELAAAAPDDAGLIYASIRCQPDGDARDQAFHEAYEAHRTHPWLRMTEGLRKAEQGDWTESQRLLESALQGDSTLIFVVDALARVRRIQGASKGRRDYLADLKGSWAPLDDKLALEDPTPLTGLDEGYRLLARGDIRGAMSWCQSEGKACTRLRMFIAASVGAHPTEVAGADDIPVPERAEPHVFAAYALVKKRGGDPDAFARLIEKEFGADGLALMSIVDTEGLDDDTMRERIKGLSPFLQGQAYVMGVILLGEQAPKPWAYRSEALLFPDERPRLR